MGTEQEEEDGWLVTLLMGVGTIAIGGWLALNGAGYCLALPVLACLISGQTLGLLAILGGVLLLWAGYDDYKMGKGAI